MNKMEIRECSGHDTYPLFMQQCMQMNIDLRQPFEMCGLMVHYLVSNVLKGPFKFSSFILSLKAGNGKTKLREIHTAQIGCLK